MKRILIIEDEQTAADRLQDLLKSIEPTCEIIGVLDSISSSVEWLKKWGAPDLIFMDIHLADGVSFEIFKQVEVLSPIIFITAFNEFAIQAFKVNSIDYLLKPLKKVELQLALEKFDKFAKGKPSIQVESLLKAIQDTTKVYQTRIMLRLGQNLRVVEIADIAYFYTEDKADFLITFQGQKMLMDYHLDEIQNMVDPKQFFRINRQFIVNIKAIGEMVTHSKSRVKLSLKPAIHIETIVSAERSSDFKDWLMGF
ncbi:MAG: DNA-binding response regulator [Bacteroidetes bacterium B1(2017)]|nr:MAG: DNA-binding response regulator [Bacteroidetes bacterium B1(2017)]